MLYSSYLELLATIFAKKQDEQTNKIYDNSEKYIKASIKSRSGTSIKYRKDVATAIFNLGMLIKNENDKDLFFEYWLKTAVGISKKFKAHLLQLLHPKT